MSSVSQGMPQNDNQWLSTTSLGNINQTSGTGTASQAIKDQLTSGSGALPPGVQYKQDINSPALPKPGSTTDAQGQLLNGQSTTGAPDPKSEAFNQSFNSLLQGQNLTPQEQADVKYAVYDPNASFVPQNLKELASQLTSQAEAAVTQQFDLPSGYTAQPDAQAFQSEVQTTFTGTFNDQLAQFAQDNNLTPDQVAQMLFAANNPGNPSITPETQALLNQVQQSTLSSLSEQYGLPQNMPAPANTAQFQQQVNQDNDQNFQQLLEQFSQENHLTEGQTARIQYIYYNPNAQLPPQKPGTPDLSSMAQQLGEQAASQTQQEDQLPASYPIQPASATYNAIVNGYFADMAREQIAGFKGPPELSDKDQQLVMEAIMDPDSPNVPENLKAIAKTLRKNALGLTEKKYRIPAGQYQPPSQSGQSLQPQSKEARAGIKQTQQEVAGFSQIVKLLQPPNQNSMLTYLQSISGALNKLQQQMYATEASESKMANIESQAQSQTQKDQINQQAAKMKEMQNKLKKMSKFGFLSKIFSKMGGTLGTIMSFVMFGPVMGALMLLVNKFNLITKMFNVVGDITNGICKALHLPSGLAKFVEVATKAIVIATVTLLLMTTNPLMALSLLPQLVEQSGIVQNAVSMFTSNPLAQQMTAMAISMAIGVASMIIMSCIPVPGVDVGMGAMMATQLMELLPKMMQEVIQAVIEAVKATIQVVEETAQKVKQMVQNAMKFSSTIMQDLVKSLTNPGLADKVALMAKMLEKGTKDVADYIVDSFTSPTALQKTIGNASSAMNAAGGITGAISNFNDASYQKIQGDLQAMMVVMNAMISNLKSLIQNLLDSLTDLGGNINDINTQTGQLYKKAESTLTQSYQG